MPSLDVLKKSNIVNKSYLKYKVLGNGNLKSKIDILADFSSASANKSSNKSSLMCS